MNQVLFFLFAIPVISFVVIALYQVLDETFKKKFILERRAKVSPDQVPAHIPKRRYADSVPPGTLRNPETSSTGTESEVSVAQVHGA